MSRSVSHSLVQALRQVPDFASLEDDVLLEIVGASANLFWSAGSVVFERGAPAEALYVVLSGRVRILSPGDDGNVEEIAQICEGDYFGEHSLLLYTAHSKSAETTEDTEIMVIPKEAFQPILGANPALAAQFRRKLEQRLLARGEGDGRLQG